MAGIPRYAINLKKNYTLNNFSLLYIFFYHYYYLLDKIENNFSLWCLPMVQGTDYIDFNILNPGDRNRTYNFNATGTTPLKATSVNITERSNTQTHPRGLTLLSRLWRMPRPLHIKDTLQQILGPWTILLWVAYYKLKLIDSIF